MNNFDFRKYLKEGKLYEMYGSDRRIPDDTYIGDDTWYDKEEDDTKGYVETMNPDLFDHVDEIVRIFKEWKNAPATEPGMEGYAKDDLVDYITGKIRNA